MYLVIKRSKKNVTEKRAFLTGIKRYIIEKPPFNQVIEKRIILDNLSITSLKNSGYDLTQILNKLIELSERQLKTERKLFFTDRYYFEDANNLTGH